MTQSTRYPARQAPTASKFTSTSTRHLHDTPHHPPTMPPQTLVVDNGSYTMKAGFASPTATEADCYLVPNCLARSRDRRVLVGAQLEICRDFGGMTFRRPVEKGYLVNWEAEKEIWDMTFLDKESPLAVSLSSRS